ncbi:hypothetical protein [Paenibacillus faecalis]|nr:hypothetical protein [Paenibacillus faecalis]
MSSIDRFILKKLDNCQELRTQMNLVKLLQIRIYKAQMAEEHVMIHRKDT